MSGANGIGLKVHSCMNFWWEKMALTCLNLIRLRPWIVGADALGWLQWFFQSDVPHNSYLKYKINEEEQRNLSD